MREESFPIGSLTLCVELDGKFEFCPALPECEVEREM